MLIPIRGEMGVQIDMMRLSRGATLFAPADSLTKTYCFATIRNFTDERPTDEIVCQWHDI